MIKWIRTRSFSIQKSLSVYRALASEALLEVLLALRKLRLPGRQLADHLHRGEGVSRPGVELGTNLQSICHRCQPIRVACVWELTKETIHLPLGCLQDGLESRDFGSRVSCSRSGIRFQVHRQLADHLDASVGGTRW